MATETRRSLLKWLAAGLGVAACRASWGQPAENAVYVGIETASRTNFSTASFFSASGARVGQVPLDHRAHGMTEHGRHLVVFPRRPGDRFSVVDRNTLEIIAVVRSDRRRHFYGHGAFSRDGQHLLIPQNDLETLQGSVAIYRMTPSITLVEEVALPGSGPHEIIRHPMRDLFHIALGGLQTHPDYGRTALNLHDFRSQVVSFDLTTGGLESMGHWKDSDGVSLRHMAMDALGRLYVGGQVAAPHRAQGDDVVWVVHDGEVSKIPTVGKMGGYVSSVAAHGTRALLASKKTGMTLQLDGSTHVGGETMDGASAVACAAGLTAFSGFSLLDLNGQTVTVQPAHEFDNHGHALQGPIG